MASDEASKTGEGVDAAVAAYKAELRSIIERRPSGTRQKLAEAFGTHKSFISQITNPAYRVPLPAQHIPAFLRVCRLSEQEQQRFLSLYAEAHPAQAGAIEELASVEEHVLRIPIPEFESPEDRAEVEALITEFADRVIALARRASGRKTAPTARDETSEKGARR